MKKIFNILTEIKFQSLPTLSLYIHIPWCIKKCPYCDFNSHEIINTIDEDLYINSLIKDLENDLPLVWGRYVHSIYLGGGTPSLFNPKSIDKLLSAVRARIMLIPNAEITMELNPGTYKSYQLQDYFQAGINRLSIGVQSFQNKFLQKLGRIHDAQDAINTIYTACKIFPKVNVDIMYALPNQSIKAVKQDILQALQFDITHLSTYQLTIEKNTYFAKNIPQGIPNDEYILNIENKIHEILKNSNFKHYEVSAFHKDNKYCIHNLNYWKFGDYLGIGAGACGKITSFNQIIRTQKPKHPKDYLKVLENKINVNKVQIVGNEIIFEFMLNALRLIDGFSINLFEQRTGFPIDYINAKLSSAQEKQLLQIQKNIIKPTNLGTQYLNNLLEIFL